MLHGTDVEKEKRTCLNEFCSQDNAWGPSISKPLTQTDVKFKCLYRTYDFLIRHLKECPYNSEINDDPVY